MKDFWKNWGDPIWAILFVVLLFVTFVVYINNGNIWSVQVLSACLGAVITILATRLLLSKQADQQSKLQQEQTKLQQDLQQKQAEQQQVLQQKLLEEQESKDKKLKTHEKKIEVYSEFVKAMWKDAGDSDDEEIPESLRDLIFNKLIFYLEKDTIDSFRTLIKKYYEAGKPKKVVLYADITGLLKSELTDDGNEYNKSLVGLWSIINDNISKGTQKADIEEEFEAKSQTQVGETAKNVEAIIDNNDSARSQIDNQKLREQAWHFIMWSDKQLAKLKEGFKELSLIEYGEYWRTNLVKQVGEKDYIFLFRRGHNGYIGEYKAIGWRVFYFEEEREEIQIFGKELQEITGEQYLSDIKEYDIYESQKDGATTCANIIVEPIAFIENGVGNPGGVYRRTISRYDSHYAWKLQQLFMEKGQWLES